MAFFLQLFSQSLAIVQLELVEFQALLVVKGVVASQLLELILFLSESTHCAFFQDLEGFDQALLLLLELVQLFQFLTVVYGLDVLVLEIESFYFMDVFCRTQRLNGNLIFIMFFIEIKYFLLKVFDLDDQIRFGIAMFSCVIHCEYNIIILFKQNKVHIIVYRKGNQKQVIYYMRIFVTDSQFYFVYFFLQVGQQRFDIYLILAKNQIMEVVNWVTKQAGKLADNFNNYKFYVKASPQAIDSSTILSLTTFTSREEQALVPCEFKWFRIKNGIKNEALQFRGNTFMCEPSDVGCFLQAQITSLDPQHTGTAILKYGPVELDILLKQTIESSLSVGMAKFNIELIHNDISKQCVFTISDEYIRIQQINSNAILKIAYNINEPLINAIPKDPTKIIIIFSQKFQSEIAKFMKDLIGNVTFSSQQKIKSEMKLTAKFLNRRQKDEFLFILKGYNAKKQLKYSIIINKVQKLQINSENINYMFTIESLQSDLRRMHNIYKNHQQQKNIYKEESLRLEQEIEEIISSYTKLIEGKFKNRQQFQQSFYEFENKKDKTIAHKYNRIQEENMRLKQFIRQNVDKQFKNVELNYQNANYLPINQHNTVDRPFGKKTRPFDQLNQPKQQDNYQKLLTNIDDQHYNIQVNPIQLQKQNSYLHNELNNSLHKIQKLQNEIQKYEKGNKSGYMDNEMNQSMNKHNTSAISISTNKVIDEKLYLEKKYQKLKEDYKKLKAAYHQKDKAVNNSKVIVGNGNKSKDQSLLIQSHYQNPQFNHQANLQISRLKNIILNLQKERDNLKLKVDFLNLEMKKTKQEQEKVKDKYQKRISELNEQIELSKRSTDVLNRSQHLNMQMDDYNTKQNEILKQQLAFMQGQNERINSMCQKYKAQYKRLKELYKASSP